MVFGIDGGTYNVIDLLLKQGELPNFEKLMKNGTRAILRSTIPDITIPSWPSMFTGCNPGKHGLYNFELLDKNYRSWFTSAQDLQAKTLWRLLSDQGKRVITLDVPGTYPPEEVNGIIVSGPVTAAESEFTYPKDFKVRLLSEIVPGYVLEPKAAGGYDAQDRLAEYMAACHDNIKQRILLGRHFIENEKWNLLFLVFNSIDRLQHTFWRFWDSSHPDHVPTKLLMEAIPEGYRMIDDFLGSLLTEPDLNIMVVSDHGFTRVHKMLQIEKVFVDSIDKPKSLSVKKNLFVNPSFCEFTPDSNLEGFGFGVYGKGDTTTLREGQYSENMVTLTTHSKDSFVDLRQEFSGIDPNKLYIFTARVKGSPGSVVELVEIPQGGNDRVIVSTVQNGSIMDIGRKFKPSSTKIILAVRNSSFGGFTPGTVAIFNVCLLEGQDPTSSLEPISMIYPFIYLPKERGHQAKNLPYKKRRKAVMSKLLSLKCTDFKPLNRFQWIARALGWRPSLVSHVYKKEDIYSGWAMDTAPDLIYVLNNRVDLMHKSLKIASSGWSAGHHPDGIFLATGPVFKKSLNTEPFSVMDIAPTILHLLGCGVPKYMDGKVLKKILKTPYDRQVKYNDINGEVKPHIPLSSEDQREIEKRLHNLGYID